MPTRKSCCGVMSNMGRILTAKGALVEVGEVQGAIAGTSNTGRAAAT
jgi:hypothetical protein